MERLGYHRTLIWTFELLFEGFLVKALWMISPFHLLQVGQGIISFKYAIFILPNSAYLTPTIELKRWAKRFSSRENNIALLTKTQSLFYFYKKVVLLDWTLSKFNHLFFYLFLYFGLSLAWVLNTNQARRLSCQRKNKLIFHFSLFCCWKTLRCLGQIVRCFSMSFVNHSFRRRQQNQNFL